MLEPEHDKLMGVEPFMAEDIEASGAFQPRLEFMTAKATKFLKESSTSDRASIDTLMTIGPTGGRIQEETIKLTKRSLSQLGDN
jgi:hypothetical protein